MRILVVEDEHRIAATIKKGLEQEKYIVDVAYTGTDGFDLATTEEYDAILLDILLPEMDGITVCKQLRSRDVHTPILLLTARGQTQDKVAGLDAGADDYVTKPFSFEELLARIRALTRRPREVHSTVLVCGDITLNPITFEVTRTGTKIQLSNKEFSLLEFLLRHPGTIVSKDQIIHHVWDYDADILPNTVEVTIRNLRNKIDEPFSHLPKRIETVRGFGYKIAE